MRDETWFLMGWRLELHRRVRRAVQGKLFVTAAGIQEKLGESYNRRGEIGKILKRLGWYCEDIEIDRKRTRCWFRKPAYLRGEKDYAEMPGGRPW